jgi:hypothetical protein
MAQRGPSSVSYPPSRSVRLEPRASRIVRGGPLVFKRKSRPFLSDT